MDNEEEEESNQTAGTTEPSESTNKAILEALKNQNKLLETHTSLLRSIDSRLDGIGRQGQFQRGPSPGPRNSRQPARASNHRNLVEGSWKFQESQEARRYRLKTHRSDEKQTSFGKVESEGAVLNGDIYPTKTTRHDGIYGIFDDHKLYSLPGWVRHPSAKSILVELVHNNQTELRRKSGIYCLVVRYNTGGATANGEAGFLIGEIEFNSNGWAWAEGADWDTLLDGKRQSKLPYSHGARGLPTWMHRKISEPWMDGDVLKFRIDTNENTIVIQRGDWPAIVLWNVLAFTNNRDYPDFLRVYAFCGRADSSNEEAAPPEFPKLSILSDDESN